MGTIVNAKEVASTLTPTITGAETADIWNPKNIKSILDSVTSIIGQFKGLKGGGQEAPHVTSIKSPFQDSAKPKEIQEVQIFMEFDQEKIKDFLKDLLVQQAIKLPDDIKQKKIENLTGENWKDFKYNTTMFGKKLQLKSEDLIELISTNLIKSLEKCQKEKR